MHYKQLVSTALYLVLVILLPACCGLSCKKNRNKKKNVTQKKIMPAQAAATSDIRKF